MLDEDALAAVAATFQDAALGRNTWGQAVQTYTETMGFRDGQLVAFGRGSLVTMNVATGEALDDLESFGGHSPAVNSRVRVGSNVPELHFLDEADFTTELDMRANEQYAEWMIRHEIGYSCVIPLIRREGMLVGLAGIRSAHQEALSAEGKRAFISVAGSARAAVNLALAFEGTKAQSVAATMDSMNTPALVYDGSGRIVAASAGAQLLAAEGRFGRLASAAFVPHRPAERDRFDDSLAKVMRSRLAPSSEAVRPMVLTGSDGSHRILEFVPLAEGTDLGLAAAAMVIFRGGASSGGRMAVIARDLYSLTPTEARLVEYLIEGRSPSAVAALTGSSVGTVRNHVHRILSKSECNSQLEFVARLHKLCS